MERTEKSLPGRYPAIGKTLVAAGVMSALSACGGGGSDKAPEKPPQANAKPVAVAGAFELAEDANFNGKLQGSDANGDKLSFHLVDNVAQGQLQFKADGSFLYTPKANYHGGDSFTFKVNDGKDDSTKVTVGLTVTPVNDAPVQADLQLASRGGQPLVLPLATADVDGDPLTVTVQSQGTLGQAAVNGEGRLVYTPTSGSRGLDTLSLLLSDGTLSTPVTVTIDNDLGYRGQITGVDNFDDVEVLLTANGVLQSVSPNTRGSSNFMVSRMASTRSRSANPVIAPGLPRLLFWARRPVVTRPPGPRTTPLFWKPWPMASTAITGRKTRALRAMNTAPVSIHR